jgi:hypothetical protein
MRVVNASSFAALLLAASFSGPAVADEAEPVVDVHAFVSQGFIKTTANNYLAESERGSFEFTEVGINFTKQMSDKFRLGIQFFARDIGPIGNYTPQVDWFYLDYQFWDWLGLRAGRTKLPFGLYNEVNDIDAARVPILLPQSVYPTQNRDYLLAQTGGELYGLVPLSGAGDLEYRAYGGTIYLDVGNNPAIEKLSIPYVFGGRLMWQTPLEGLQLGGSLQKLRLDFRFRPDAATLEQLDMAGALPTDFPGFVDIEFPILLWAGSIEYSAHDFLLAAEYGRWQGKPNSSAPTIVPETELQNERYYVMASYRVTPWFTPGVYYSTLYPNVNDRKGRDAYQNDVALTLRYDLNPNWLVKVEGHYMHGTAGLSSAMNDARPLNTLQKDWGLFMLKTTAYF